MTSIGVLTIGEAPRPDALARDVAAVLGPDYEIRERGALDGLSAGEVAELRPGPDDDPLVTLRADGAPVQVGKRCLVERLQAQIERLETEDRVAATLLVCTGPFPALRHRRPLLQPQAALYGIVRGLAAGARIAAMPPLPEQAPMARREWAAMGVDDLIVVPADPYQANAHERIGQAAREAREQGAQVLFMDCFGFDLGMRQAAAAQFGGPVVLARSAAARIVAEVAR